MAVHKPWVRVLEPGKVFVHTRNLDLGKDDPHAYMRSVDHGGELMLPPMPCVTQFWRDGLCACSHYLVICG